MTKLTFPDGFLWGAATAGHQIEGGNVNSDWWPREVAPGTDIPEPSGDAADSYHRYREDIASLAASGLNTYRFSLEWSRIEPAEGMISRAALDHYRRVIDCCHEFGVQAAITIYHFTTPRWFADDGGWRNPASIERFARFTETVLPLLHTASHVFTINEPNILAMIFAGKEGNQQIQAGSLPEPDVVVTEHIIAAHRRAAELVRTTGRPVGWPVAPHTRTRGRPCSSRPPGATTSSACRPIRALGSRRTVRCGARRRRADPHRLGVLPARDRRSGALGARCHGAPRLRVGERHRHGGRSPPHRLHA